MRVNGGDDAGGFGVVREGVGEPRKAINEGGMTALEALFIAGTEFDEVRTRVVDGLTGKPFLVGSVDGFF